MSRVPVLVACLFAIALLLPSITAQEEESSKIPLSTLPLGPDTDTFHISLTNGVTGTPIDAYSCRQEVGRAHYNNPTASSEFLYATNDKDDVCRTDKAATSKPQGRGVTEDAADRTHTFVIHIMPVVEELVLDEGETISGTVHMYTQRVGTLTPTVTLETDEGLVGSAWTAAEASTITDGQEMQWHQFDFDLGAAPAKANGALRLNVTVSISADGVGYGSVIGYGIGYTGDKAGFVNIPITSATGGEEPEPVMITCPDGTEVENGTDCPEVVEEETGGDNNTTEEDPGTDAGDASNNTTAPQDDNNTASTDEKKGLPGFGLVAVLVSGFVGAAVVRRRDLRVRR